MQEKQSKAAGTKSQADREKRPTTKEPFSFADGLCHRHALCLTGRFLLRTHQLFWWRIEQREWVDSNVCREDIVVDVPCVDAGSNNSGYCELQAVLDLPCVDAGSNNSGYYELQAVLTHKGRSSSSGHYVAWVRSSKPGDDLLLPQAYYRTLFTYWTTFTALYCYNCHSTTGCLRVMSVWIYWTLQHLF